MQNTMGARGKKGERKTEGKKDSKMHLSCWVINSKDFRGGGDTNKRHKISSSQVSFLMP